MYKKLAILFCLFNFSILIPPVMAQSVHHDSYEKALQSFNGNDIEAAYIHLKNTLKDDSEHIPGKILMGRVLLENKYYADAVVELTEALALGGDIGFIIEPLGDALYFSHQFQDILQLADKRRLSSKAKVSLHLIKAKAYAKLKQPAKEWQEYRLAYRLAPYSLSVLNQLATYHISAAGIGKAQLLLDKIFGLAIEDYYSWHIQGMIYKGKQQYQQAINSFLKTLEIKPDYVNAKRALAAVYVAQEKTEQASMMIDQVLLVSPNDPRAKLLKANLLLKANENTLAKKVLTALNQHLSLASDEVLAENDWIHFINGVSAFLLENYELSISELNQYLSNQPDNFHAIHLLSQVYIKVQQRGYARDLLDKHRAIVQQDKSLTVLLCDLYLESQRAFKCEALLETLLKNSPHDVEVILLQARLYFNQGKTEQAIVLLEHNNKSIRNSKYENYLISLYLNAAQPGKAAFLANKLLSEFPDNIELMNSITAALVQMEMYPHAFKVTQDILVKSKGYFPAKYNQAVILHKLKQPVLANKLISALLKQRPKNLKLRMLQVDVEVSLGQSKQAIFHLNEIITLHSQYTPAKEMLVMLLKLSGQYEQALVLVNNLIQADRLSTSYIKIKAELLFSLGERQQLLKQLNILFSLWVDDALNLVELSDLQRLAKDFSGARKSIDRALKLSPSSNRVLYADAKLSIFEQDKNKSQSKISNLQSKIEDNAQLTVLEGDMYLAQSKIDKAQTSYLTAFSQDQKHGVALVKSYNLAILGYQKNQFEQVLIDSLQTNPKNFYYRNLLADFYLLTENFEQASLHYLQIKDVPKLPNKGDVLNNLANSIMHRDLAKAELYAQKASKLNVKSAAVHDTYGWILAQRKKLNEALTVLRNARSLDTQDPSISYHLGYTLFHLDRKKEAYEQLKFSLDSGTQFSGKKKAEHLIKLIRL